MMSLLGWGSWVLGRGLWTRRAWWTDRSKGLA